MLKEFVRTHRLSRQVRRPRRGGLRIRLRPNKKGREGSEETLAPTVALWVSRSTRRRSVRMWQRFDHSAGGYQYQESYGWMPSANIYRSRGVDGLSRFFVRLTSFRTPLCVLASMEGIKKEQKGYYACFRALEGLVIAVFVVTDLRAFYVCFEAVLIPMFRLIGVWGSRQRKIRAAYFFFLYTLIGSVRMLVAILSRYKEVGTTDMSSLMQLASRKRTPETQQWMWLAFFASFAVKVPMVPVHIWLPEAHVEAPTAGSVILAGILLKLGTYGMVRRLIGLFPMATVYYTPRVYTRAMVAIVYTSRTAIRQTDMKRIIAYASVAHMNMTLVGLFSRTQQGVEGAVLQMLSHGLVSGALFMCVGVLYDRHHTRLVSYYGGVAQTMPRYVMIFLFFTMANIALPGTSSFVGEFMILRGVFQTNPFVAFVSATSMILGGAYSLWLFNRIAYGNLKTTYVGYSVDRTRRERLMFVPLVVMTLVMGIYPNRFLDSIHTSCANRIEHVRINA